MEARVQFLLLLGAISVTSVVALPFPIDLREVRQLMAIVDPPTCGCVGAPGQVVIPGGPFCQIHVPGAEYVGLRCAPGSKFCCRRKKIGAPATFNLKEIAAQIPNNLRAQVMKEAPAAVSDKLRDLIVSQEEREKVKVKPATEVRIEKEAQEEPVAIQAEEPKEEKVEDSCSCVENPRCPQDNQDFTFGKSCSFGYVRCCLRPGDKLIDVETDALEEPEEDHEGLMETAVIDHSVSEQTEEEEDEKRPTVDLPIPLVPVEETTSTTTIRVPTTTTTTTTSSTTTELIQTTSPQETTRVNEIPQKQIPTTLNSFTRHSVPAVPKEQVKPPQHHLTHQQQQQEYQRQQQQQQQHFQRQQMYLEQQRREQLAQGNGNGIRRQGAAGPVVDPNQQQQLSRVHHQAYLQYLARKRAFELEQQSKNSLIGRMNSFIAQAGTSLRSMIGL